MKPEWPLYGIALAGAAAILALQGIFDWSDQTRDNVGGAFLALAMAIYLPLVTRRRERREAGRGRPRAT